MSENSPNLPLSLTALAERVRTKAEEYARSLQGEDLTDRLRQRLAQIEPLVVRAAGIVQSRKLVKSADPKLRLSRQQLHPKLTKVKSLEEDTALDVTRVLEPKAFDPDGIKDGFDEAEKTLLESWQKFARPKQSAAGAAALADVPALAETVQQIHSTRQQLETDAKALPKSLEKVAAVRELQQKLATLSDTLRTHGCDEDVLAFLAQARKPEGIALAEVLKNPKVSAWLAAGRNADALRIIHKSALNPMSVPAFRS